MKLEVGMYVRTNEGLIGKITWCCCKNEEYNKWVFTLDITGEFEYSYLLLDKEPSFNPIELIEKGDYVNGYKVLTVNIDKEKNTWIIILNSEIPKYLIAYDINSVRPIKSIVTKEEFSQMEYKVED